MKIPLCRIETDNKELDAIKEVIQSGWLAHGPKNKEFEKVFSQFVGTKFASCFNSCASALQTAIMASGIKGEIIVPSFSYSASANTIVLAGCKPVFCEANPVTFNIDVEDIEHRINENTVGIMVVHYAGQICEMDKIMELARKYDLVVIEDSAETIGAELNGKKSGSFGIGCFSFYPTKNITTGEGGMITYSDDSLTDKINPIKAHGLVKPTFDRENDYKSWYRDAVMAGYNFRMSDINAALGVEQMKKIDSFNKRRQENATYLNKKIKSFLSDKIQVPEVKDIKTHVYQMYVIKVKDSTKRDDLLNFLKEKEIGASVHFAPPIHEQSFYKENYPSNLPVTDEICASIITLPMFPSLTKEEMDYVVDSILEFFKND